MSECFSGDTFDYQKFCRFFPTVINFIPTCFCASSCPRSLGFCGCNRTWHKARDIVVTDPTLSVCGSNTRCVKRNTKTNKCKTVARVFRLRYAIGTPVWTRFPRFPKCEQSPLIYLNLSIPLSEYPDAFISANHRKVSDLFYSFIYYSLLQSNRSLIESQFAKRKKDNYPLINGTQGIRHNGIIRHSNVYISENINLELG